MVRFRYARPLLSVNCTSNCKLLCVFRLLLSIFPSVFWRSSCLAVGGFTMLFSFYHMYRDENEFVSSVWFSDSYSIVNVDVIGGQFHYSNVSISLFGNIVKL